MQKTIKMQVENGEMVLHWWEAKDGSIANFLLEHDAPQDTRSLPGQITGGKDKLQALIQLVNEIKRLYPVVSEGL